MLVLGNECLQFEISLKNRLPCGVDKLILFVVPSSTVGQLDADQAVALPISEVCCRRKVVADDGHETITALVECVMFNVGNGVPLLIWLSFAT